MSRTERAFRLPSVAVFTIFLAALAVSSAVRRAHGEEPLSTLVPENDPEYRELITQLTEHVRRVDAHAEGLQVPDFPEGKAWFNSPPLSFRDELAGKIVVLDFWTYCCINCIHVLPDLAWLEAKYSGFPVAFVGVHSAKFDNEKSDENVRLAVRRYEIRHPVINDDEMALWRGIGVRSWPTLAVVGPKGNLLLMVSGEGQRKVLDAAILAALDFYPEEVFRHEPLPTSPVAEPSASPLRYPGKLAIDRAGRRLFISDSNHHRVVICDLDGQFVDVIGSGTIGLVDGSFEEARFNRLQGVAYDDGKLWVADTENHALRRIDLAARTVTTVAGDGLQGRDYRGGGSGRAQRLSTPWDVAVDGERVYIAMAGTHQIWVYDEGNDLCSVFSGTGRELNANAEDRLLAAWAQPSGLTLGDGWLFVADSESSSIRGIELATGVTRSFAGGDDDEPRNLFAFGDVDGEGDQARLQHALGVLWLEKQKRVVVVDTYNHRLKLLEPATRRIRAWVGSGVSGLRDGSALDTEFSEPSGLALGPAGRDLYVADTNNHAVRVVELESLAVRTLELVDVPAPAPAVPPRSERLADLPGTETVRLRKVRLRSGSQGRLVLRLHLPDDHHYSPGADSRWQVVRGVDESPLLFDEERARGSLAGGDVEVPFRAGARAGEGLVRLEALAYFCEDNGACRVGAVVFELPVEVVAAEGETSESMPSALLEYSFTDISRGLADPLAGTTLLKTTTDSEK